MTDDELEVAILEKYVARHQEAETAEQRSTEKCARELDMREVLHELTSEKGANLDYLADLWIGRLAPRSPGVSQGPLRPCSDSNLNTSAHKFHARRVQSLPPACRGGLALLCLGLPGSNGTAKVRLGRSCAPSIVRREP